MQLGSAFLVPMEWDKYELEVERGIGIRVRIQKGSRFISLSCLTLSFGHQLFAAAYSSIADIFRLHDSYQPARSCYIALPEASALCSGMPPHARYKGGLPSTSLSMGYHWSRTAELCPGIEIKVARL